MYNYNNDDGYYTLPPYLNKLIWEPCATLIVEEGITDIGNYAFYNAKYTSCSIPLSVITIGDHAFEGCFKTATSPC